MRRLLVMLLAATLLAACASGDPSATPTRSQKPTTAAPSTSAGPLKFGESKGLPGGLTVTAEAPTLFDDADGGFDYLLEGDLAYLVTIPVAIRNETGEPFDPNSTKVLVNSGGVPAKEFYPDESGLEEVAQIQDGETLTRKFSFAVANQLNISADVAPVYASEYPDVSYQGRAS